MQLWFIAVMNAVTNARSSYSILSVMRLGKVRLGLGLGLLLVLGLGLGLGSKIRDYQARKAIFGEKHDILRIWLLWVATFVRRLPGTVCRSNVSQINETTLATLDLGIICPWLDSILV